MLEGLCHNWGFYFTCTPDRGYLPSSEDLSTALMNVTFHTNLMEDISLDTEGRGALNRNRAIAHWQFSCVLAARLFVFKEYVQLISDMDDTKEVEMRTRWVILQTAYAQLWDIFVRTFIILQKTSTADLDMRIAQDLRDVRYLISCRAEPSSYVGRRLTIVIDEAQVAADMLPRAFASTDLRAHSPLLEN